MLAEIPEILTLQEVTAFAARLATATFADGRATARGRTREIKHNLQLPPADPVARELSLIVKEKTMRSPMFASVAHPRRVLPFRFCKYTEGMGYGEHLDIPLLADHDGSPLRTDLSVTLFLSCPSEYEGGALVFQSESGEKRIRGEAGSAVVYPSSTLHQVEPVTRGTRLVAITWIESLIRDPARRKILFDLVTSLKSLESQYGQTREVLTLRQCHYNLARMWIET